MDEHNVDFCVLSLTAPGIQDFVDPKDAAEKARLSNDWVAAEVKKNPKRFGAFAALAMHDPKTASEELTRCVKDHGFLGALVNDNQRGGPDGETPIFYDQPEWDSFWQTCVDLDVCVPTPLFRVRLSSLVQPLLPSPYRAQGHSVREVLEAALLPHRSRPLLRQWRFGSSARHDGQWRLRPLPEAQSGAYDSIDTSQTVAEADGQIIGHMGGTPTKPFAFGSPHLTHSQSTYHSTSGELTIVRALPALSRASLTTLQGWKTCTSREV